MGNLQGYNIKSYVPKFTFSDKAITCEIVVNVYSNTYINFCPDTINLGHDKFVFIKGWHGGFYWLDKNNVVIKYDSSLDDTISKTL